MLSSTEPLPHASTCAPGRDDCLYIYVSQSVHLMPGLSLCTSDVTFDTQPDYTSDAAEITQCVSLRQDLASDLHQMHTSSDEIP